MFQNNIHYHEYDLDSYNSMDIPYYILFAYYFWLILITHSPHCQVVPDCDRHCRSSGDSDSWSILPEITTAIQSTNHIISNIIVSRISILFTNYFII